VIIRHPHEENYSVIHNHGLTNAVLSWKARGLLAFLLTKPNTWEVMMAHLVNSAPDGREAVRSGLAELEEAGYIVRGFTRGEGGTFDGHEVVLYEFPQVGTGNGFSDIGGPDNGQSPPSKDSIPLSTEKNLLCANKKKKTDTTEAFEELWKIYPRKLVKSKALKAYKATVNRGIDHATLFSATQAYAKKVEGTEQRFVMHGSRFFGPDEEWRDFVKTPVAAPTGEALAAAILWDKFFTSWGALIPGVPCPHLSAEGRTYTTKVVGPDLNRIWDDET
jgi:hypothetical protein